VLKELDHQNAVVRRFSVQPSRGILATCILQASHPLKVTYVVGIDVDHVKRVRWPSETQQPRLDSAVPSTHIEEAATDKSIALEDGKQISKINVRVDWVGLVSPEGIVDRVLVREGRNDVLVAAHVAAGNDPRRDVESDFVVVFTASGAIAGCHG
jgi:hypothetical protein